MSTRKKPKVPKERKERKEPNKEQKPNQSKNDEDPCKTTTPTPTTSTNNIELKPNSKVSIFKTLETRFWKQYNCKCNGDDEDCENCQSLVSALESLQLQKQAGVSENGPKIYTLKKLGDKDEWKPMAESYYSVLGLRTGQNDEDEAVTKLYDAKIPEMNHCEFDNGMGGCYKGFRCFKSHKKPGTDEYQVLNKPTAKRQFSTRVNFKHLPNKHLPSGRRVMFPGYITYADSPNMFYILPDWDFECECRKDPAILNTPEHHIIHGDYFRTGKFEHEEIHQSVKHFVRKLAVQSRYYAFGDLVICQHPIWEYTRGVVLENTSTDFGEKISTIPIFLYDIGEIVQLPFIKVYIMPINMTTIQPLVYKCSLFGVTSVGLQYSTRAKEFFSRLLSVNKSYKTRVWVEIMDLGSQTLNPFSESVPYIVDLTIKFKNTALRVADILQDFGLAVQFNLFKERPAVMNSRMMTVKQAMVLGLGGSSASSDEALMEKLSKEDMERLKKLVKNKAWKSEIDVKDILKGEEQIRKTQVKSVVPAKNPWNPVRNEKEEQEAVQKLLTPTPAPARPGPSIRVIPAGRRWSGRNRRRN